jgi:putative NIF3 family GTP cyclohydrolase 1 type 2
MRHHDVLDAVSRGVSVILAGHTQTERPYLPVYRRRLVELTGLTVKWRVSNADQPPSRLR